MRRAHGWVAVAVIATAAVAGACDGGEPRRALSVRVGDVRQGEAAIESFGCGACHTIPGVRGADALVGPPLTKFGERSYIAGQLVNTPENLVRWIMNPQDVEPGTAMPDLGVPREVAEDMAAYLLSLD